MDIETYRFKDNLKKIIKEIWIIDFNNKDKIGLTDSVIPTGHIDIVFNFKDDYFYKNNDDYKKLPRILISGLQEKAINIKYGGNTKMVGIVLTPIGFLSFFDKPVALCRNSIIDGSITKWNLSNLYNKIEELNDIKTIAEVIRSYFNNYDFNKFKKLNKILHYIDKKKGCVNIKDLSDKFHLSESAFERYFKKNTGITPKAYSNIIKFKYSLIKKEINDSDLYYDQSYLIKNCKKYTGKTPKELIKKEDEITFNYILENADFLQYFDSETE